MKVKRALRNCTLWSPNSPLKELLSWVDGKTTDHWRHRWPCSSILIANYKTASQSLNCVILFYFFSNDSMLCKRLRRQFYAWLTSPSFSYTDLKCEIGIIPYARIIFTLHKSFPFFSFPVHGHYLRLTVFLSEQFQNICPLFQLASDQWASNLYNRWPLSIGGGMIF